MFAGQRGGEGCRMVAGLVLSTDDGHGVGTEFVLHAYADRFSLPPVVFLG